MTGYPFQLKRSCWHFVRVLRAGIAILTLLLIIGCSTDDPPYVEYPVEDLYNSSMNLMASGQYQAAAAGFDEVEIDDSLAARQPAAQWQFRAGWKDHNYQARLRG